MVGERWLQFSEKWALASGFIVILTFTATITTSHYKSCVFTLPKGLVHKGYSNGFDDYNANLYLADRLWACD